VCVEEGDEGKSEKKKKVPSEGKKEVTYDLPTPAGEKKGKITKP